mmetsp:Transcript_32393/g.69938  ORF Transcript_32393/g.69938 Transcript_32393/m.69938 type:complete len:660 (-) Transcript_32393:76-2055(-)
MTTSTATTPTPSTPSTPKNNKNNNKNSPIIPRTNPNSSPSSSTSPLHHRQATALARKMRSDLRPHTKDRKWHFKSYPNCFKATHALSWAVDNMHSEEGIAVERLNQLADFGYIVHVVDPTKRFRVGETKTLYFRMASDAIFSRVELEEKGNGSSSFSASPGKEMELIRDKGKFGITTTTTTTTQPIGGEFGSRMNSVRRVNDNNANADAIQLQQQLDNVNRTLQQAVKDLNNTRGKLEVVHQEVLGLVSQQISTFIMIFLMYIYTLMFLVPWSGINCLSLLGLAVVSVVSTRHGLRCISLWNDMDGSQAGGSPMLDTVTTTVAADDDDVGSSLAGDGNEIVRTAKTFDRNPTSTSTISSVISRSIRSMKGASGRSSRRLSSGAEAPHVVMREAYTLPDVATWRHRPLFVCVNSAVSPNLEVPHHGLGACPLGVPFSFSSELFEGTCLIRLKGSISDDPKGDEEYFSGRKRIFQSVVQGRFKEEVPVSQVLSGHEFARPLENLPHPFLLKTATNFIGKVSPGANIAVHTDRPHVEAPLGGTSQVMRGDEPGNEPNIACRTIVEDCSVLGGVFEKGTVSASRRKRLLSNPARCEGYAFDTETVFTFEFYQNLFDAQTYSLDLGFAKIGCSTVLNGQPIQWLGKMRDGRYLWVSVGRYFCIC